MDAEQSAPPVDSNIVLFSRGFFVRLLYGSLGVPILFLVRPDLFREDPGPLVFAAILYFGVCIAGGFYDVHTKQRRVFRLWAKSRWWELVLLVVILLSLWLSS